jgi:hypothetical protein
MRLFRLVNGEYVANLTQGEQVVLVTVVEQVKALVEGEVAAGLDTQPSLDRLFPPASTTDGDIARDFAALTGRALRDGKAERLGRLAKRFARSTVRLDGAEAHDVAAAINDVRLAVAEIAGIRTADDAERVLSGLNGPELSTLEEAYAAMYGALSALQQSLIDALNAACGRR